MPEHENELPPHDTGTPAFDPLHGAHPIEEVGYEVRDFLGRRALAYFGLFHFLGLIVTLIGTYFLLHHLIAITHPGEEMGPPDEPPTQQAPVLQPSPHADMEILHKREQMELGQYGWVDESKGIARIPIEKAIEITAERGLPTRQGAVK